jgi:hypothetical protein
MCPRRQNKCRKEHNQALTKISVVIEKSIGLLMYRVLLYDYVMVFATSMNMRA